MHKIEQHAKNIQAENKKVTIIIVNFESGTENSYRMSRECSETSELILV